ncbi:MAG: VOC family protein [Coleofasciculaceae cyanobacterium]
MNENAGFAESCRTLKAMIDIGLTHIALPASNIDKSIDFYLTYAALAFSSSYQNMFGSK